PFRRTAPLPVPPTLTTTHTSHCSPTPPHPHSFPTRRSSDLRTNPGQRGSCCTLGFHTYFTDGASPEHRWVVNYASWISPGLFGADRKSTRLNSSHGSISYAVFCLKKKKKRLNNTNAAIDT